MQPSWSPERLSGANTSSQSFSPLAEDRLDRLRRRIGEARQIVVPLDREDILEEEHHVFDGGLVDRHRVSPTNACRRENARTTLFTSKLSDWRLRGVRRVAFRLGLEGGYLMGVLKVAGSVRMVGKLTFLRQHRRA